MSDESRADLETVPVRQGYARWSETYDTQDNVFHRLWSEALMNRKTTRSARPEEVVPNHPDQRRLSISHVGRQANLRYPFQANCGIL